MQFLSPPRGGRRPRRRWTSLLPVPAAVPPKIRYRTRGDESSPGGALRLLLGRSVDRGGRTAPSKIAVGLWGREGTAHFRRLTPPSFAAQNPPQGAAIFIPADVPQGHGGSLENRRSDGGREGTAHFRRLTPPSFAAQNPLHCDARPQHGIVDAVGCSHRASAMENPPWQGAAIFIHADVPQGHGGSLENHLPSD